METIAGAFLAIAFFVVILSTLYNFFWVDIETVAKPLVRAIIIIATLFVGYDLFITVFSYGTWAVFFKTLVGSIIIVLPIFYVLYWLKQYKNKRRISLELNTENLLKNAEYKRLLSLGWSNEIATRRAFGENSSESLANPIKEVKINVDKSLEQKEEVRANHSIEDLKWEYGINVKEPTRKKLSINIELDINKSFAWFTNRTLPTKITIILFTILFLSFAYDESTNNTSYESYEQDQDY